MADRVFVDTNVFIYADDDDSPAKRNVASALLGELISSGRAVVSTQVFELPSDLHPLEAKKQLALEITATYHSSEVAQKTLEDWNQRFSEKRLADANLPEFAAGETADDLLAVVAAVYAKVFGITKSRTDVRRLITQGSVQVDGEKITDPKAQLSLRPGQVLRLDKTRAVRIA